MDGSRTKRECASGGMKNPRWPRGSLSSQCIENKVTSPGRHISPQGLQTFRLAEPIPSPGFPDLCNLAESEAEFLSKYWFRPVSLAVHVKRNLGKLIVDFDLGNYCFHRPQLKI